MPHHHTNNGFIAILAVIIISSIMISSMATIALLGNAAQNDLLLKTSAAQARLSAASCAQLAIKTFVMNPAFSKPYSLNYDDISCEIVATQIVNDRVTITTSGTYAASTIHLETVFDTSTKKIISINEKW